MSHSRVMSKRPVILIADDDPAIRRLVEQMFEMDGRFRIGVALDGLDAAMLAEDLCPDVAVLDYFMPRWDGERAALYIRSHCPKTRIVAFSAVLENAPSWSDAFLVKTQIAALIPLVCALTADRGIEAAMRLAVPG